MLQPSSLKFLKALRKNNNKPWFEDHRAEYEKTKTDFLKLTAGIINGIGEFDEGIAGLSPKDCIFRINRDVRFSKDKKPYKNNMAAYFNKDGKKGEGSGYYIHIEPGSSFIAGGIWMPEPAILAGIRQEIDYNLGEWTQILNNRSFKKYFPAGLQTEGSLLRPPKGYEPANPAISFLKMKNFIASRPYPDQKLSDPGFIPDVVSAFRVLKPFISFLNRSLD